jgi:hypothetical protein
MKKGEDENKKKFKTIDRTEKRGRKGNLMNGRKEDMRKSIIFILSDLELIIMRKTMKEKKKNQMGRKWREEGKEQEG